jgi:HEAT repeat protein
MRMHVLVLAEGALLCVAACAQHAEDDTFRYWKAVAERAKGDLAHGDATARELAAASIGAAIEQLVRPGGPPVPSAKAIDLFARTPPPRNEDRVALEGTRRTLVSSLLCVLAGALHDDAEAVRCSAMNSLVWIGVNASPACAAIAAALADPSEKVRVIAARAMYFVCSDPATAVDNSLALMRSADAEVRWSAVHTIVQMGPAGARAMPTLEQLRNEDDSERVREHCDWALSRIRN